MRCPLAIATPQCLYKRMGALLLLGLLTWPTSVSAQALNRDELRKQAAMCEKQHDWRGACCFYYELLQRHRDDARLRQAYQRCLRRYRIVGRHQDKLYRTALERLTPAQALDLYVHVLETIDRVYTERQKSSPAALFAQGLDELRLALQEPVFTREYFSAVAPEKLDSFHKKLAEWRQRKIASRSEAREQVGAIGRTAQQICSGGRPILLTVIALEFLSGACNALDEYTFFLTPGHYREVQDSLRGRLVSIGVDLEVIDEQLVIRRVYPRSPAERAGLMPHDRIVRIEGQSTRELTVERAAELLRGKSGTLVRLEIVPFDSLDGEAKFVQIKRALVTMPSVEYELLPDPFQFDLEGGMKVVFPIGKLTINYFQESTLQEVKDALTTLQTLGMKVLILDLRHNPGGLFKSAVEVAEMFLPEGIVVVSQSHWIKDRKLSGTIRADHPDAFLMPVVVLIDGETASAAEVLAGALKDNGRAKLVGQPTYGKGTLQCVIQLDKPYFERMPGGIRITVAKLLSPHWQPYSGKGVEPNFRSPLEGNDILIEARQLLFEELRRSLQALPQ
jgi:carboxyl-terminal processing protease